MFKRKWGYNQQPWTFGLVAVKNIRRSGVLMTKTMVQRMCRAISCAMLKSWVTLRQSNVAMEHPPFIDNVPSETFMSGGFSSQRC